MNQLMETLFDLMGSNVTEAERRAVKESEEAVQAVKSA